MKKIMLGTSNAWLMSRSSHRPSEPAYCIEDCRILFLGGVYAIGDIAFCLGFAVGPALSGSLVQHFGFKAMMVGIGIISFFYGPLLFLLKDPPPRTEQDKQETTVIF